MLYLLLKEQTITLIQECESSMNRFYQMREENRAPHFFDEVKPHADSMHVLLDKWQQSANEWIQNHRTKYMHSQQINACVDSMKQFIVQSFYKETSKKRFIQSVQSALYTLNTFLRYLQEGEQDAVKETND